MDIHGKPPRGVAKGPLRRHGLAECLKDFVAAAQRSAAFVDGVIVDLGAWLRLELVQERLTTLDLIAAQPLGRQLCYLEFSVLPKCIWFES